MQLFPLHTPLHPLLTALERNGNKFSRPISAPIQMSVFPLLSGQMILTNSHFDQKNHGWG